jgi:hypothetical protein
LAPRLDVVHLRPSGLASAEADGKFRGNVKQQVCGWVDWKQKESREQMIYSAVTRFHPSHARGGPSGAATRLEQTNHGINNEEQFFRLIQAGREAKGQLPRKMFRSRYTM